MKTNHDTPPALYRISDGQPLSLNNDGTYSLDNSVMGNRCSWTYRYLVETGLFTADASECCKNSDE